MNSDECIHPGRQPHNQDTEQFLKCSHLLLLLSYIPSTAASTELPSSLTQVAGM